MQFSKNCLSKVYEELFYTCLHNCFHTAVGFFFPASLGFKSKRQCNTFIFLICPFGVSASRTVTAAVLMHKLSVNMVLESILQRKQGKILPVYVLEGKGNKFVENHTSG